MTVLAVTLTDFELRMAAAVGVDRFLNAIQHGWRQRAGNADARGDWSQHIEGACGEVAVAKALGRYWNGSVGTFKDGGDVGYRVQVRTRSRHDYDLIVRADDKDDDYFILVTGRAPAFVVRGYVLGHDAKREEWQRDHGGHGAAFFVPQTALTEFGVGRPPIHAAA